MSLHDQPVPIRRLRVVNPDGGLYWGYMHDDEIGRRIAIDLDEENA